MHGGRRKCEGRELSPLEVAVDVSGRGIEEGIGEQGGFSGLGFGKFFSERRIKKCHSRLLAQKVCYPRAV